MHVCSSNLLHVQFLSLKCDKYPPISVTQYSKLGSVVWVLFLHRYRKSVLCILLRGCLLTPYSTSKAWKHQIYNQLGGVITASCKNTSSEYFWEFKNWNREPARHNQVPHYRPPDLSVLCICAVATWISHMQDTSGAVTLPTRADNPRIGIPAL